MSSPATPRWEPTPEQQVILNLPGTVEMATPNVRAPALPGTTHHWAPLGTIGHHWAPLGTIGHHWAPGSDNKLRIGGSWSPASFRLI